MYAEVSLELHLFEKGQLEDLTQWLEPIRILHEKAIAAHSVELDVSVIEVKPHPMVEWALFRSRIWE
jgi:hypothetical protein